ncbi:hypothetical protein FRC08_017060, partial [Ceratobasidium sp. 394]
GKGASTTSKAGNGEKSAAPSKSKAGAGTPPATSAPTASSAPAVGASAGAAPSLFTVQEPAPTLPQVAPGKDKRRKLLDSSQWFPDYSLHVICLFGVSDPVIVAWFSVLAVSFESNA